MKMKYFDKESTFKEIKNLRHSCYSEQNNLKNQKQIENNVKINLKLIKVKCKK